MSIKKSVLLIGKNKTESVKRLQEEALVLGIVLDVITPEQVRYSSGEIFLSPDTKLEHEFLDYDTYFFRGLDDSVGRMQDIAKYLQGKNKRVVERCFSDFGLPEDKLVPQSRQNMYLVPESKKFHSNDLVTTNNIKFPVVLKALGPGSSKGRFVQLISDQAEFIKFCLANPGDLLLQEYYKIDSDTRVLVIGDKCLGGFDRYKVEGENFLTTRRGGKREARNLSPEQINAAFEATQLQGLEIAGIDMFISDGQIYIIEVNCSPQFNVFEKKTGVNVAREMLVYLTSNKSVPVE